MFPSQLMMIRKSKSGIARSVLLDERSSDYAMSVMEIFRESMHMKYSEIEEKIKDLEIRSENPKVVRGIFTVISRLCTFSSYSPIPPEQLRMKIFTDPQTPSLSEESRNAILERIGNELNMTVDQIESSLYGDMESERILNEIPPIDNLQIIKKFNREQVETALMKGTVMDVKMYHPDPGLLRFLNRIGLLYSAEMEGETLHLKVSGPISPTGKTERYGPLFSMFLRKLLTVDDWEAEAEIELGKKGEKSVFKYYVSSSMREILDINQGKIEEIPEFVMEDDHGVSIDGKLYFVDYRMKIGERDILIIVSRLLHLEENLSLLNMLRKKGERAFMFVILRGKEKCPSKVKCFKNSVDWYAVREYIEFEIGREGKKREIAEVRQEIPEEGIKKPLNDNVIKHLEDLYPDSSAMVDYLEFMGFDPSSVLTDLGYKIRWRGLRIEVTGRRE